MNLSRRGFALASAVGLAEAQSSLPLTAASVISSIRSHVGIPWRAQTVDTIKSGTPATPVKGIATTMMATFDVVQKAAALGLNMVITHEPTFYSHEDKTEELKDDPVYRQKQEFLDRHEMVVFRFHDHWHAMKPDGIATGMVQALGWSENVNPNNPREFSFSGVTLADLAAQIQDLLKIRTMRVVGDPALKINKVAANWGYSSSPRAFARKDIDALIIGEAREWELVEYAADAITGGAKRGLIVMGHIPSEQGGMQYCSEWLKGFISEVPIRFVPAVEPFWRPSLGR